MSEQLATEQKLCRDCKWHKKSRTWFLAARVKHECHHPQVVEFYRGKEALGEYLATGKSAPAGYGFCSVERSYEATHRCGTSGKLWEERGYDAAAHSRCYP